MSDLVVVSHYTTRFAAEEAQRYLADEELDAIVQADDAGGMFAGLSLHRKGVRLLVRAGDEARAAAILSSAAPAGPVMSPAPLVAAEHAARNFDNGDNCAEAVLRAFVEDLEFGDDIVRLATGFGGGMGRDGDVCGAVVGGVMALGLRLGRDDDDERADERCYEAVRELRRRFRLACGALDCRELTGIDLNCEKGRQEAEDTGVFATVCRGCVRTAAEIVAELTAAD